MEELAEFTENAHEGASFNFDRDSFSRLWYATPFMYTRDADPLEESNWTVISNDLLKTHPEGVETHSFGHWGFGWYERLYVRADDALAIRSVQSWADSLASYGVANDEHLSEVEWNQNHPSEKECYSSDPDCRCDFMTHSCGDEFRAAVDTGNLHIVDEEWYCDFCSEWNPITNTQHRYMNTVAARAEIQAECAALEAAGQLAFAI
ncbi:hypothetical protein [Streptomyces uncialis]|uniref:hypothetical protein n=1 Tax=Streptomyces uncialis TaxID=1048205 RepID=UPI00116148E9|nr:hypothetical protein [Streptomyces uncialis]